MKHKYDLRQCYRSLFALLIERDIPYRHMTIKGYRGEFRINDELSFLCYKFSLYLVETLKHPDNIIF